MAGCKFLQICAEKEEEIHGIRKVEVFYVRLFMVVLFDSVVVVVLFVCLMQSTGVIV